MRRLGISIYPEKIEENKLFEYIDTASSYGFTRIFSCLLSVNESKEDIINKFNRINTYAKSKGFIVIMDVNPRVFRELDITYDDLSFFKKINADGFRLDQGFSGNEEAMMTYNKEGLIVEINMSMDTHTIDTIMDYMPNKYKLYGCHNFYPHRYTGMTLDYFKKCNENFNKYGIHTAAFVSSQNNKAVGPWDITDKLSSLEIHRDMPIELQAMHMIAMGDVDDIIISNMMATNEELYKLSKLNLEVMEIEVEIFDYTPELERKIIKDLLHTHRGDSPENMIRSTKSREIYKDKKFNIFNAKEEINIGDILIESSEYGQYAGELQIAKRKMLNSGKTNVVGRIKPSQLFLLYEIKLWQKFILKESE